MRFLQAKILTVLIAGQGSGPCSRHGWPLRHPARRRAPATSGIVPGSSASGSNSAGNPPS